MSPFPEVIRDGSSSQKFRPSHTLQWHFLEWIRTTMAASQPNIGIRIRIRIRIPSFGILHKNYVCNSIQVSVPSPKGRASGRFEGDVKSLELVSGNMPDARLRFEGSTWRFEG